MANATQIRHLFKRVTYDLAITAPVAVQTNSPLPELSLELMRTVQSDGAIVVEASPVPVVPLKLRHAYLLNVSKEPSATTIAICKVLLAVDIIVKLGRSSGFNGSV